MSEEKRNAITINSVTKTFKLPHMTDRSLIKQVLRAITFRKNDIETQVALKDVTFDVVEGEFLGILGRNGSGKSTMLKILAGIYQPSSGEAKVDGKIMPFIELGVGFNPELTGRENVFLSGALLGFSKTEMLERFDEIVEFAELDRFIDQKLKNYSSGMQVRLAFSIAIQAEADVLLIDEVLAVGDAAFQRKCFDYFRRLKKSDKTIVFVTHDMESVREYCDRAVVIDKSKLVSSGNVDEAIAKYQEINQKVSKGEEGSADRFGDGTLKVNAIKTSKRSYGDADGDVEITMEVVAKKDIEGAVVGMSISDQMGRQLIGTNTSILKKDLKSLSKSQKVQLTWKVPNIFNEGKYFVSVEAKHQDAIGDTLIDAKEITVFRERVTGFVVVPKVRLDVKKK